MEGGRTDRYPWLRDELARLRERGQLRQLTVTESLPQGWLLRNGRKMLNLASNDYLGLSNEPFAEPVAMQIENQQFDGTGSTASRLIVGHSPVYEQFEREFAAYKGTESCLLYSCGYMANTGAIAALVGRNDMVFSDKLNHASIVDGITLSRAAHHRYHHRDLAHLEQLLAASPVNKRKFIVTDAVFSMDGTLAPLAELVALKERYGAMLMVDEAHSGGVYGEEGQGLTHALGLTGAIDVHMGTFSKAYGCYGAYIAGDQVLTDYLVNTSRSLIYTTALPPSVIRTVRERWLQVKQAHARRNELLTKANYFRSLLGNAGFQTGEGVSQIIPLLIGDNERTLAFSTALQEEGVAAVAIRPPTVPEDTARIRFSLMSTHRTEDLEEAASMICRTGRKLGLI